MNQQSTYMSSGNYPTQAYFLLIHLKNLKIVVSMKCCLIYFNTLEKQLQELQISPVQVVWDESTTNLKIVNFSC